MVSVLRLGHRVGRDDRISTHVGLTARQWGCNKIVYAGQEDNSMMESVRDISERWGGDFSVEYSGSPISIVNNWEGSSYHLTMYGQKPESVLSNGSLPEDSLVVVGSQRVPRKFYKACDFNISIGNQPHSEIAALAAFLDRFSGVKTSFEDADIEVIPSEDQKRTREK